MQLTITVKDEQGNALSADQVQVDVDIVNNFSTATFTVADNSTVDITVSSAGYETYTNTVSLFDNDEDIQIRLIPVNNDPNDADYRNPYPWFFVIYEPCSYNAHIYNGTSSPFGTWSYYFNNVLYDSGNKNIVVNLDGISDEQIKQRIVTTGVLGNQLNVTLWDRQYATIETGNVLKGDIDDIAVYLALDPATNVNISAYEYKPTVTLSYTQENGCCEGENCVVTGSEVIVTPNYTLNTETPSKVIFSTLPFDIDPVTNIQWQNIEVLQNVDYVIDIDVSVNANNLELRVLDQFLVDIIVPVVLVPGPNQIIVPTGINSEIILRLENTDAVVTGSIASFELTKPSYFKCATSTLVYSLYNSEGDLLEPPLEYIIDNLNPQIPADLQYIFNQQDAGDLKVEAVLTNCCTFIESEINIKVCFFFKATETKCNTILLQNCSLTLTVDYSVIDLATNQQISDGQGTLAPGESVEITPPQDGIYSVEISYDDPLIVKYFTINAYCNLRECLINQYKDILCTDCDCDCNGVDFDKVYFNLKTITASFALFSLWNEQFGFGTIFNALQGPLPADNYNDQIQTLQDFEFLRKRLEASCKNQTCGTKNSCGCN